MLYFLRDLFLGLLFLAMIILPCVFALRSANTEEN